MACWCLGGDVAGDHNSTQYALKSNVCKEDKQNKPEGCFISKPWNEEEEIQYFTNVNN